MTIRYECGQCGSILKIKDDLAGKPGKCPKCRTAFTVPQPEATADLGEVSLADDEPVPAQSRASTSAIADDDFDPAAFLMQDEPAPKSKRAAATKKPSKRLEDEDLSDDPHGDDEDSGEFKIRRSDATGGKTKTLTLPNDEDEEDDSDSRKKSRSKPAPAVSAVAASNVAGDLLSQSAKKGRKASWNEVQPAAKAESNFDWEGMREFVLKEVAPKAIGGILLIVVLFFGASWLFGGKSKLPDLGRVTGKVTIAGMPAVGVTVIYHPIRTAEEKEDKKKWVTAATAVTDDQGNYDLVYVAGVNGAPIGSCRVEIEAPGSFNVAKQWVGPKSTVTKEVKAGKQIIDLDLSP